MLVYGILIPILPPTSSFHQIPESQLGVFLSVYSVGMIVTPMVAIISDKCKNRKIPMCLSSILLCISSVLFAVGTDPTTFLLGRMGQGIAGGVSWMIGFSMLADAFPNNLGATMGSVMTANTIGNLAGPPLGGFLFDSIGKLFPLYFCAGICIVDTIVRLTIRSGILSLEYPEYSSTESTSENRPLLAVEDPDNPSAQKSISIWKLTANVEMSMTLLSIIVGEGVLTGIEPTMPLYLGSRLGLSAASIGMLWICISIPKMFACTWAGFLSDRYGRKKITALGLLILSIACILVSMSLDSILLALSLAVFGIGAGVALTPGVPEMAEIANSLGDSSYGTVYSLYNFASSFGMLLGPIFGTWVYTNYDFETQLVAFGLCSSIMFIAVAIHERRFVSVQL
jgi:MFS family permease